MLLCVSQAQYFRRGLLPEIHSGALQLLHRGQDQVNKHLSRAKPGPKAEPGSGTLPKSTAIPIIRGQVARPDQNGRFADYSNISWCSTSRRLAEGGDAVTP